MNLLKTYCKRMAVMIVTILVFLPYVSVAIKVEAAGSEYSINRKSYSYDDKGKYEIDNSTTVSLEQIYVLDEVSISGMVDYQEETNGYSKYLVDGGDVAFSLAIDKSVLNRSVDEWKITRDSTKEVNGYKLSEKIANGAVILQTSLDGKTWVTDVEITNIFTDSEKERIDLYKTSEIQLQNGCYYRVIVVYEMQKRTSESFWGDKYDKKKIANVYQVYLETKESKITSATTPRKELGELVNTGKDNGYSGVNSITIKDPHYGWSIGKFFVNGYTRETKDESGKSVFLKNVGDKVTLWFTLSQDINNLHGEKNLKISEDVNGYDQYFGTEKTNLKHGAMIIRYTDEQGVKHDPIIYTNFLEASARTGADTRVQLFEEGDYEVALDYEIVNTSGIDSYTNYRVYFEFSIRNGNCMVYPFDVTTNYELNNGAITTNGFRLDMAKSKYLTIDVKKSILIENADGSISEDVRFNRPAKDGDNYTEEGIYTFTVSNLYTNETTTKVVYVGENKILKALSTYEMTVEELNSKIAAGGIVEEDGSITTPILESPGESSTDIPKTTDAPITEKDTENNTSSVEKTDTNDQNKSVPIVPIVISIVVLCGIAVWVIKMTRKPVENVVPDPEEGEHK